MASSDSPPEETIAQLVEFTGLPRIAAITRLRANNNDLERAISDYFDDDPHKYNYDESQFGTDREGQAHNAGVSFNIQGPDALGPSSYQNSAAPTRPPSRATNRSPLGAPSNAAEEDSDLQRALAASMAHSGYAAQEVGIIDNESNPTYFGPATRSEYDSSQWALVPTKATQDVVEITEEHPAPAGRRRDADAPAFLRQVRPTKSHRVGAMLSIYHKIPLARNVLLHCGSSVPDYGRSVGWWRGETIQGEEPADTLAGGETTYSNDVQPNFSQELHRLMAFLDKTERSYGTVDSLTESRLMDPSSGWDVPDFEEKLSHALKTEGRSTPEGDIDLMTTVGETVPVVSPPVESSSSRKEPFIFLDVNLEEDQYSSVKTIYDALDQLLWRDALSFASPQKPPFPDKANFLVIRKPAEVVTIRLGGDGFGTLANPCDVPPVFYADRYMADRKQLAIHFQTQMHEITEKLQKLAKWEQRLIKCNGKCGCSKLQGLGETHDIRECHGILIKRVEHLMECGTRNAQWRFYGERSRRGLTHGMNDLRLVETWTGPFEPTPEEETGLKEFECILQDLKSGIEQANHNLAECKARQNELESWLEVIRKRLTCQENEVEDDLFVFRTSPQAYRPEYWDPSRKYLLRGVAVTNELAYVCVRQEADLMEIDGIEQGPTDQWWKIGYVSNDASPVKSEKVTLDEVLQAASNSAKHPIVVYATEAALEATPVDLSDALRMFVKTDNRMFKEELAQQPDQQQHQQQQQQPSGQLLSSGVTAENLSYVPYTPAPGAKRKHSVGSSVATHGSSRDDLGDVDLAFSDDPSGFNEDAIPRASHAEFSGSSLQYSRVPGPARHENGAGNMEEMVSFDIEDETKAPEMEERNRGSFPLLTVRPGARGTQENPIDMMDLDTETQEDG